MFASIVVGTDGSPTAAAAVQRAWALAAAHSSDLHIVSAYQSSMAPMVARGLDPESLPISADDRDAEARAGVQQMLDEVRQQLAEAGVGVKITIHAVGYDAVTAILDVAKAQQADLIVVGNKGMRGTQRKLGSVPDVLAHNSPCDVLIVNTT
jgi:nucleotide-binding universal stress UspA family protein